MEYVFHNFPRIVTSQEICMGKPRIKGTRIPVSSVLAYLAGGMSVDKFLEEFHWVEREDVLQALAYDSAKQKRVAELIEAIEWSNARNRGEIEPETQSFRDFLDELEREIELENQ